MNKKLLGIAALVTLAGCGSKTVYVEATTTTVAETTTTSAPAPSRPPANYTPPSNNYSPSYDPAGYDDFIYLNARDFWLFFSTEDLLQMGLIVCDTFDSGASLEEVNQILINSMTETGTLFAMEGIAAMSVAAMTFLCPEHSWWLETI